MRRAAIIWLAIGTLCLLSATSSAQEPATVLERIQVVLKTSTVQVRTLQTTQMEVRLRDANGALRAVAERLVPAAGIQDIDLRTTSGFPAVIQPGDSVVVTVEGEDPVVITPAYLDARPIAGTGVISVQGPPNQDIGVEVQVPDEVLPRYFETTTDEDGLATLDLADIDLRPGVGGRVFYQPVPDRYVVVSFQVPTVVAKVGSDWIEGYAWAEREISLTLSDDAGQLIAATRKLTDGTGYFSVRLAEEFANLRIQSGQTIGLAWEDQQITLDVPELSIRGDPAGDRITGRGPAGADLSVTIYDQATRRRRWYYPTTDETGHYQVDLAGFVDVNPDDDGSVIYETPEGHKLVAEFRIPFVELEVGGHRINGRGVENAEVILDLRAGDGTVKATAQTTVDTRGNFTLELEEGGQPVPVDVGDSLRISVVDDQVVIVVPAVSVHLDPILDRVTGQGPPGEPLQISLAAGDDQLTRDVTPATDGTYALNVRGLADIRAGAFARATYTTPGGHRISAQDRLMQLVVQVGSDYVAGVADADAVVDVFVRGADGKLRDWAQTAAEDRGRFAIVSEIDCRTPVVLAPGDAIEVRAGDDNASLVIPSLTITLDAESDQVAGTGPPGATVEVRLTSSNGSRRDQIAVGSDGRYSLAYAPEADIRPGDRATVEFISPEGHEISARANVPSFSATIGSATLRGSVQPLQTVQVMLRDGQDTLKAETVVTGNRSGRIALLFRDSAGRPVPIEAGDFLEVEADGPLSRLQVPPLSLTLDPAGPTANGTTLPDAPVDLMFVTQSRLYLQHAVTADGDGHYEAAFDPDIAVRAGDWVRATINTIEGFQATALWSALALTVYSGTNYVGLQLVPGAPVTVTLRSSTGTLRATASADPEDEDAYLFTSDGQPVAIQSGDRVVLEQEGVDAVTGVTVPDFTMTLVPDSGTVNGTGPAGSRVTVSVTGTGGEDARSVTVPVWADGTYEAHFAGLDLGPGGSASVSYADPETGHRIVLRTYRGWLRAHVGTSMVEVRAHPLSEIALQLRGSTGTLKSETGPITVDHLGRATVELTDRRINPKKNPVSGLELSALQRASASSLRIYSQAQAQALIHPGDYLELTATDGITGLTIPEIPLQVDIAGDQVSGAVLGQGGVVVTLVSSGGCTYERQPKPGPGGVFNADFSYDADIGAGDRVTLRYTTPAGHELQIQHSVGAAYLPLITHH